MCIREAPRQVGLSRYFSVRCPFTDWQRFFDMQSSDLFDINVYACFLLLSDVCLFDRLDTVAGVVLFMIRAQISNFICPRNGKRIVYLHTEPSPVNRCGYFSGIREIKIRSLRSFIVIYYCSNQIILHNSHIREQTARTWADFKPCYGRNTIKPHKLTDELIYVHVQHNFK